MLLSLRGCLLLTLRGYLLLVSFLGSSAQAPSLVFTGLLQAKVGSSTPYEHSWFFAEHAEDLANRLHGEFEHGTFLPVEVTARW